MTLSIGAMGLCTSRTRPTDSPHKATMTLLNNYSSMGSTAFPGALNQSPGAPPARTKLQLLIKDLPRPNGIVFSPDERFLYVNNSEPKKFWMRYSVSSDGSLTDGKVFYDATSDNAPGAPDGMKVDQKGNVYSAGPGWRLDLFTRWRSIWEPFEYLRKSAI